MTPEMKANLEKVVVAVANEDTVVAKSAFTDYLKAKTAEILTTESKDEECDDEDMKEDGDDEKEDKKDDDKKEDEDKDEDEDKKDKKD